MTADMSDISDRLLNDLVDAVKDILRKEQSDRLRDVYLIGDIDKDNARSVIERLRELANDNRRPITLTSTAPAATSPTASPFTTRFATSSHAASRSPIIVQGMAYSMGSVVLQAASDGQALRVSALVDHDSRAREVGRAGSPPPPRLSISIG